MFELKSSEMHQIFNLFAIFFLLVVVKAEKPRVRNINFINVTCQNHELKSVKIEVCRVLPNGFLDLEYTLNQPVNLFVILFLFHQEKRLWKVSLIRQMGFICYVKFGNKFKKLFQTPGFDMCSIISDSEVSASLKTFLDQIVSDSPLFKKCPYSGKVDFKNFAVRGDGPFSIYPAGMYQFSIVFSKKKNQENLVTATIVYSYKMKWNR